MEIRSYRKVFDLERRVYSVDRLRLNPGGVPVRGIVYFVVALLVNLILGRVPLLGAIEQLLPWYVSDLALPLACAAVLSIIRVEGRTFHLAAHALLRYLSSPRRLSGLTRRATVGEHWHPPELLMLPDGSDSRIRRLRYSGPGAVLVTVAHERGGRIRESGAVGLVHGILHGGLLVRERVGGAEQREGEVISLAPGTCLRTSVTASRAR